MILVPKAIFFYKANSFDHESEDFRQYHYYFSLVAIAGSCVEIYVDLFLLWLLYRFMKPHKVLEDETAEVSTLMFAHDASSAQESLLDSFEVEHDKRKANLLKQKHNDFLAFVIKDWLTEIDTE